MVFRKNFARSILSDGILPFAISTALMDTFMTRYPIMAAIPATPSPLARPIATLLQKKRQVVKYDLAGAFHDVRHKLNVIIA